MRVKVLTHAEHGPAKRAEKVLDIGDRTHVAANHNRNASAQGASAAFDQGKLMMRVALGKHRRSLGRLNPRLVVGAAGLLMIVMTQATFAYVS